MKDGKTSRLDCAILERAIVEASFDGVVVLDDEGRLAVFNPAAERIFGYPAAKVLGKSADMLVPRQFRGRNDAWKAHFWGDAQGYSSEREVTALHSDGRIIRVAVGLRTLDVPDHQPVLMMVRDPAPLRRAESHLADAMESINDGFALFGTDDRLVRFNRRFTEMLRSLAGRSDLMGMPYRTLMELCLESGEFAGARPVEDPEGWLADRLEQHRNPPKKGVVLGLADGRTLRIQERRTDEGGTVSILTDVTALTRTETRLLDAIEGVAEGFALWDARDCLVMSNRRYREAYPEISHAITHGVRYRDVLHKAVAAGVIELPPGVRPEEWVSERLRQHVAPMGTHEQKLSDGRWIQISERRTRDGGVVAIETDVTNLKEQEEKLRENEEFYRRYADELLVTRERLEDQSAQLAELAEQHYLAREKAEAASLAKSQFLAIMSHELRTPLNAIMGFSQMLKMEAFGPLGGEKYREYAEDIYRSGAHLLDLITDVLDMSKIEAGNYELTLEPCNLSDIADESLRMVRGRAEENGILLAGDIASGLPPLIADRRTLKQCLINLLTNAVKFTPGGGSITLRIRADGERCIIEIQDTGIGIAAEDLPRITEPFVQVEREKGRSHEGAGLGLALTKKLVEMHEGFMRIASELGVGTTITVDFPLAGPKGENGE